MLNVLIVDDETIVCDDLRDLIDWNAHGFDIVGEASDGQKALKILRQKRVDLIIADITMPLMNGIEMAKIVRVENRSVKFIFLTAYEDFNYAREAMRIGISSYILKHEMDENTLLTELHKVKKAILEEDRQSTANADDICCALFTAASAEECMTLAKNCSLKAGSGRLFTLIVDLDRVTLDGTVKDDLRAATRDALNNSPEVANCLGVAFLDNTLCTLIELKTAVSLSFTHRSVLNICGSIQGEIKKAAGITPFISASRLISSFDELYNVFNNAQEKLKQKYFYKIPLIFFENANPSEEFDYNGELSLLNNSFAEKKFDTARGQLEDLLLNKMVRWKNLDVFSECLKKIIAIINSAEKVIGENDRCINTINMYNTISGFDNIYQAYGYLSGIVTELEARNSRKYSSKMKTVLDFIEKHYEEDIDLETVSGLAGVTTAYMSQLFKNNTGISFKLYLMQVRVQKAKELLALKKYKVYEVGEMTGFHSTQYFCITFKRVTGSSPSEYLR